MVKVSRDAPSSEIAAHVTKFTAGLKAGVDASEMSFVHSGEKGLQFWGEDVSGGYFGEFGGRYIPETLVEAHRWARASPGWLSDVRFSPHDIDQTLVRARILGGWWRPGLKIRCCNGPFYLFPGD